MMFGVVSLSKLYSESSITSIKLIGSSSRMAYWAVTSRSEHSDIVIWHTAYSHTVGCLKHSEI